MFNEVFMMGKIYVNNEQEDWLQHLGKLHNLKADDEIIQKLIDCYKAWNENLTKHTQKIK